MMWISNDRRMIIGWLKTTNNVIRVIIRSQGEDKLDQTRFDQVKPDNTKARYGRI